MEKNKPREIKHLRVFNDTHTKVKILASTLGMTVDECINYLLRTHNGK